MRLCFVVLILVLSACSSDPSKQDWDSGAARESAFQEETMNERDSSVKDQMPNPTPATNQTTSP